MARDYMLCTVSIKNGAPVIQMLGLDHANPDILHLAAKWKAAGEVPGPICVTADPPVIPGSSLVYAKGNAIWLPSWSIRQLIHALGLVHTSTRLVRTGLNLIRECIEESVPMHLQSIDYNLTAICEFAGETDFPRWMAAHRKLSGPEIEKFEMFIRTVRAAGVVPPDPY